MVYLFAAAYCEPCKEELPAISKWRESFVDKGVSLRVLLVSGKTPGQIPTQGVCDEFKSDLGLHLEVIPDKFAKTYRKYYEGSVQLPACVIVDLKGSLLRVFPPGKITGEMLEVAIKEIK